MGNPVTLDFSKAQPIGASSAEVTLDFSKALPIEQPSPVEKSSVWDIKGQRAGIGGPALEILLRAGESGLEHIKSQIPSPRQAAEMALAPPGSPQGVALSAYRTAKELPEKGVVGTVQSAVEEAIPLPIAKIAQQVGRREYSEAAGTLVTGAAELYALGRVVKGINRTAATSWARRTTAQTETQANNLAAALDTGGVAGKGTATFEDIAKPILDDFRMEAAKQGKTPTVFKGRRGYVAAQEITRGVRAQYDRTYKALLDPIRNQPAPEAAQRAATALLEKVSEDTQLIDDLTRSGNMKRLLRLKETVEKARTIGELDDMRVNLNRLSSKYLSKPGAQQYQSPVFQEALDSGANAIRAELYPEIVKRYSSEFSEADIRELQKLHGASIAADNLMETSANAISRIASEEKAAPSLAMRVRGSTYRLTMTPRHAIGGMLERLLPKSELDLFNLRMQRVLSGVNPKYRSARTSPIAAYRTVPE